MTAKVIKVVLVFNVLATFTASASGAHGEANACVVNPASGGTEQVRSCSDSTSLLQAQVRTHSTGGGQTSQSSRKSTIEESNAREEVTGKEEAKDEDKEDELEEDKEQDVTGTVCSRKGKLTVTVVKASGVVDKDWFSGESDPYVTVTVNCDHQDKKCEGSKETSVVKNSANPTWNQDFIFDNLNKLYKVCFVMKDSDTAAKDDYIGEKCLHCFYGHFDDIFANGEKTYSLTGQTYRAVHEGDFKGWDELTVKLKWQQS